MSLLLPFLIYAFRVFAHDIFLTDLLTRLIPTLLYNLTFSVDLLQHISLLNFVPFHHSFALGVHMLIIGDQVQRDIIKESLLMVVPQ